MSNKDIDLNKWHVGQGVVLSGHYRPDCIKTISRITKTQIIIDNDKFGNDGYQLGDAGRWSFRESIKPATDEDKTRIKYENYFRTIKREIDNPSWFKNISTEDLKTLETIINKYKNAGETNG